METFVKGFCSSRTHCKASTPNILCSLLSLLCPCSVNLFSNVQLGLSLCFRIWLVWFLFLVSCLEHGSSTTMILPNATCSSCILQHCCLFPQCCTYLAGVFRTRLCKCPAEVQSRHPTPKPESLKRTLLLDWNMNGGQYSGILFNVSYSSAWARGSRGLLLSISCQFSCLLGFFHG